MKRVIKHQKKIKNTMYIVFGVFALALFVITRINPSYADNGLIIDNALDAIVLYGEVETTTDKEVLDEVQDEDIPLVDDGGDEDPQEVSGDENEETLDGEEVDNVGNDENNNEDGDEEGKTEEIEKISENEELDNEPEVQIPEIPSDEDNHGLDNKPSEEAISEEKEQYLIGNVGLRTVDVGDTITITYNANLGEFEGGENTKDVVYTYTEPTEGTKYSHTPNISDAGVQSGNYSDNLANNHTIGIPGSLKLHISLNYATEKSYDYLYIFKGTYTGTPTKNMKEGQLYTFNGDSSNTLKTSDFYVDGDEVTFSFYSDSSSNYYGYYATIEGIGGYVTDETIGKPIREGYSFVGWYETGAENPYDFSQKVTENKILYAKRDVAKTITYNANGGSFNSGDNSKIVQDVIYSRQSDGTYIPDINIQFPNKISDNMAAQSGWMFDGWYTSATNQTASTEWTGYINENTQSQTVYAKWLPFNDLKIDIGGTGFTIMDRNLGATSNDISSSNSYGKYYQWGNNYGFSTYDISLLNTSSTKVDETPYGPGNYYSSATYITTDDGIRTQDYDFGNLWGGNTNTDEAMQGPCPIGYHVSSSDDIWDVYEAFQYWVYHTDEGEDFCNNYDNHAECFSVKTHFPLAGYYDDYNKITNQNDGYYWTSYKKSWPSALILMIESSDPSGGYPAINGFRMGGLLPVRCFKNEYEAPAPQSVTVTYNANGGKFADNSTTTGIIYSAGTVINPKESLVPTRDGYIFTGWYTVINGGTEVTGHTVLESRELYAHWVDDVTQTRREGCFQFRNLTNTTVEITDYSDSCSRNLADEGGIPSIITRGDKGYTVTSIGYQAFNNSDNRLIGSVVIPDTVEVISGYAFSFNNITGLYLGSGVRTIGMYAYANNKNLSGVVFGDNLSSIEEYAFYNSALGRVDINSIDSIGRNAFQNNHITVVNILDDSCVMSAWTFYNNPIITLNLGCGGDIQESTFSSNNLRILTLGSGVTSIGYNVFSQSKIEEIIIPDSVTYIGRNAFQYNYNLEKIKIGNGVTEIGEYAFSNNTALENLDLGESLEIIGNYAFYESSDNLTGLKIPDSVQTIGNYAFGFLDNLGYIKLGSGLKNVGQFAFAGAMNFSGTMLPDSIENLGTGAFCTDQKQDEGSVVGLVSSNVTDEQIQTLESQENTACFVIKKDKYNVKLSGANDGSDILVEVPYNTEFNLSAYSGTKSGWYFEGWASDSASTGALSDNPVVIGELVLYPIFRKDLVGTFNKDSSVSSITTNSATCTLWNNESSCTLTAPTINCANGYSNGVWSPLSMTISENTTFTASCNDVQKPVCNISTQPTRTLMSMVNGYNQGTVTFTCTDNVGVSTNNLSASNITYDSDVVTLSNFIVGGTSTSKTFTFTYTAKVAGNTSFTLKAGVVSDVAGNSNLVTSASNSVTVDTTAPVLSTKTSFENIWYTANQSSTFTYTDTGAGITAGENTASCTISTEGIASTCQITPNICDKVGNCNTTFQTSNSIKLDKTAPVFTGKTQFTTGWYNTDQTSIFIYEDTVSGISGANTTSCVINEEGTAAKCTVENTNICNNAGLCNTANQTSNSIKLDKTNPICSITGNPTSPINQDVELTLNYLVESNQISTGYSWDGEVYTSTQKFTVTQNGTYTGYVRDTAGNTGSCSVVVDKIDKNLPVITINNPDTTTAQSKTITATKNKGTLYMSITGANVCDSTLEFIAYAEITFNLESDNGKYVCYKAEDSAGNVVYKISNQIAGIKEPSKSSGGGGGTKKSETDTKKIAIETSDEQHNSADDGQETKTPEVGNTPSNEETSNQVISVTQEILEDGTPVEVVIQTVAIKNTDIVATVRTETVQSNTAKSNSSRFTKEENDAYSFAKSNGITTTDSIDNAKMNTELTRIQMAKMLSNFAINVLGEEPDVSKGIVKFDDVTNKMDDQYDNAVTKAYQLGIMGQNMKNNEFRPNDEVTRAEFASALSRLLYKTDEGKYRSTGKYYIPHVVKLYNEGIINKTDPKIKEKRGYVMLMLMRTVQ